MEMKAKTIYYLKGQLDMPAHRVGSPKKDDCGQTPWYFIDGKWKGETVYVEPEKMWRWEEFNDDAHKMHTEVQNNPDRSQPTEQKPNKINDSQIK